MFSKTITSSSAFLMMPLSTQALYFQLGMNADDDGFCEHFSIMRMVEAKPDDLKVLQAKEFVKIFDERVLVVLDWKENNYLRNDRYTPSKYLEVYKEELRALGSGIPNGNQMDTQDRIGKERLGKENNTAYAEIIETSENEQDAVGSREVISSFKRVNPSYLQLQTRKAEHDSSRRMIAIHGLEEVLEVVDYLEQTNALPYFPTIIKPTQLEEKWGTLVAAIQKKKNELTQPKARGRGFA